MSQLLKHSALAWILIVTQLAFSVFGPGRLVVCHDEGGPSHIEFAHSSSSPNLVADHCGQAPMGLDGALASLCTGLPCVDEVVSFTATLNSRRGIANGSLLTDLIPTGPPLSIVCALPENSVEQFGQDTGHEVGCRLLGLQSSLRTTVLVI